MSKKIELYGQMADIINANRGNLSGEALTKYNELEVRYLEACKAEETEQRFNAIKSQMEKADTSKSAVGSKKVDDAELREAFVSYIRSGDASEIRALNSWSNGEGGALIPTTLANQIVTDIAGLNVFRTLPGVKTIVASNNVEIPLGGNASVGYVAEAPSGSYGATNVAFGKLTLKAHKIGAKVSVTEELLNDSAFDVAGYVGQQLAQAVADFEETEFLAGAGGASAIQGLFGVTAVNGVNVASTTVSTGSAATADTLIDAYTSLAAGHQSAAVWLVGQDAVKLMMKAKDGNGQYLYNPVGGLGFGTFLGRPVVVSSKAAAVGAASGATIGALVDPRYITIGDRTGMALRRLNEIDILNGNIVFNITRRTDAVLTNAKAIRLLVKQ